MLPRNPKLQRRAWAEVSTANLPFFPFAAEQTTLPAPLTLRELRKCCRFNVPFLKIVREHLGLTNRRHKSVAQRVAVRTDLTGNPVGNVPLLAVAAEEYGRLRPHLEPVEIGHRQILHEAGEKIRYAYFLNDGLASMVVITRDGRSVEIGLIGREGIMGTPLAVGLGREPHRAIMQIPGNALRIRAEILEQILPYVPDLQLITHRYVLMRGLQVAQIAACNRLHEIEQRLARWLLMCQDRVEAKVLPVSCSMPA